MSVNSDWDCKAGIKEGNNGVKERPAVMFCSFISLHYLNQCLIALYLIFYNKIFSCSFPASNWKLHTTVTTYQHLNLHNIVILQWVLFQTMVRDLALYSCCLIFLVSAKCFQGGINIYIYWYIGSKALHEIKVTLLFIH